MTVVCEQTGQWDADCRHWWGVELTGDRAHWCPDWDYLPIDETVAEYAACTCYDGATGETTQ